MYITNNAYVVSGNDYIAYILESNFSWKTEEDRAAYKLCYVLAWMLREEGAWKVKLSIPHSLSGILSYVGTLTDLCHGGTPVIE